jgi:Tol biopolymer transport system component
VKPSALLLVLPLVLSLLAALPLAVRGGADEVPAAGAPAAAPAPAPAAPSEEVVPSTPGPDGDPAAPNPPFRLRPPFPGERHFASLRQITFGGQNAEAYWSGDERRLVFQAQRGQLGADQIFVMDADGRNLRLASTGKGRTTCAYFLPGDQRILYASTHLAGDAPPTTPPFDPKLGYVWSVFSSYDVFTANPDGSDVVRLTDAPGYDAEATVSPRGDRIVFTSTRDGDLDLYSMAIDGTDVKRLTDAPGYDGGAFYSADGAKIVWRAPNREDVDVEETRSLLARELVRPRKLEIWVMDADGSNKTMITRNGAANFAPYWHPDGRRVVFSSNMDDPRSGNFELYLVDTLTGETARVTHFARTREGAHRPDDFDGFPMFTRDGKRLVFCSNRWNDRPNETNVFVADWVD